MLFCRYNNHDHGYKWALTIGKIAIFCDVGNRLTAFVR